MQRAYTTTALVFCALTLTSCASIFSSNTYPVAITSSPDHVNFTITNQAGEIVHSGLTPQTVTLKSSPKYFTKARYTIRYEKAGYGTQEVPLTAAIDGWYWGNLLIGGVIGMMIVDPLTGSMWKLPEEKNIALQKTVASYSSDEKALHVVSLSNIPASERQHLIPLQ